MRSGQPLTGTNGKRCREDEKLLNAPLRAGKRGYVIDTRPLNVAQQARAKGGGFEQEAHYPQWRRIHKAIERYTSLLSGISKDTQPESPLVPAHPAVWTVGSGGVPVTHGDMQAFLGSPHVWVPKSLAPP